MKDEIWWLPNGGVTSALGFLAGSARGGLKTSGDDVILICAENVASAAAVFTKNLVQAAPVLVCAQNAASGRARAIVANAGNANCCTGAQGLRDAEKMCEVAAQKIGCRFDEVLVCSTGIIGHALPLEKVVNAINDIQLSRDETINEKVARAIMTTDTRPKFFAAQTEIAGKVVTVGGLAKGAGMIAPEMGKLHATLLSFLTTDAAIDAQTLQTSLQRAAEKSFNSVTIDGDTSTNDSCLLLASGASNVQISGENLQQFQSLLEAVCVKLAQEIARDGEGATKLVTIKVSGADTENDAKKIAMTVANSPLVKTAIFGKDPNWGRIAAAAGRAGVSFDAKSLGVQLNGLQVFQNGEPANFSLSNAESAMSGDELLIEIVVGAGAGNWTAWTCDFSYDYVRINAEYHT